MDAYETGRPAEVGSRLEAVKSWDDVADVVYAMLSDLEAHPDAWVNVTLPQFLDGLAGLVGAVDRLTAEDGAWSHLELGPELVANLLVAASGYE